MSMAYLKRFRRLRREQDGSAAVEFSLLAPVLIFGSLMTVDLGMAIHERMSVDAAMRAGAQAAMTDPGEADVQNVVETTGSKNFTMGSDEDDDNEYTASTTFPFYVNVSRYCACPDAPTVEVSCSSTCSGEVDPYVFYGINGSKTYSAILFPNITHQSSIKVQVE